MNELLPPQSRGAERAVLAAMLRSMDVVHTVAGMLTEQDFYVDAHRRLFKAILDLADAGKAADVVTLVNRLSATGDITDVGLDYITGLLGESPSAVSVDLYADIIGAKALARRLIHASTEIATIALDPAITPSLMAETSERLILDAIGVGMGSETFAAAEVVQEAYIAIDDRYSRSEHSFQGLATGFCDLDAMTAGLQRGELYVLAARPGFGKTALGVNVARHVIIDEQAPVLIVSLEQNRRELMERLLCCQAHIDGQRMRIGRLRPSERERLLVAGELVEHSRLFISDTPSQTMTTIAASARRMKRMHNIQLMVIDYLQLITVEGKRENRQEQVADISRRLKLLARELLIPIIVLAQLNREVESRQGQRPRLSDLRESGAIEQDADTVFLLHRHDDAMIDLIVGKQRNGPTGDVRLLFVKQQMRFESLGVT